MKSSKIITTVIALFILSASSTFAFDGEKKGFVLSGGVTYMPVYSRTESFTSTSGGTTGGGIKLSLGVNWNNRDMIAFEMIGMGKFGDESEHGNGHGYQGINWYHDLNPEKNSFFTAVGAGFSLGGIDNDGFGGVGLMLGGGYEISKHFQLGLNYFYMTSSTIFVERDYRFNVLHLTLTASAF